MTCLTTQATSIACFIMKRPQVLMLKMCSRITSWQLFGVVIDIRQQLTEGAGKSPPPFSGPSLLLSLLLS